jgi:hypothetical protein
MDRKDEVEREDRSTTNRADTRSDGFDESDEFVTDAEMEAREANASPPRRRTTKRTPRR